MTKEKRMVNVPKMTINDHLEAYKGYANSVGDAETVAWCDERIAMYDKRYANRSQKTKNAHNDFDELVYNCILMEASPMTVSELIANHTDLETFSNQIVTSALTRLVKDGKVYNTKVKSKSYYAV